YSLFTSHVSLFTIHASPFTLHHSPFTLHDARTTNEANRTDNRQPTTESTKLLTFHQIGCQNLVEAFINVSQNVLYSILGTTHLKLFKIILDSILILFLYIVCI